MQIILCMFQPIFHTSCSIVLDSIFFVLKGIVALKEKGVFAAALIKKLRYLPTLVPREHVLDYIWSKVVSSVHAISGNLNNIKYQIHHVV